MNRKTFGDFDGKFLMLENMAEILKKSTDF